MSRIEEGRYGRVCLLVLNVCPFTLRHVIDDYCLRHGSLSLFDFLEKNKHSLFHQFARECCCRNLPKTRSTPMCKHQWESLFIKNTSSCRKGKQFDCPCQFDSKKGITTKGIDVTMCCLLINSTCHGVDIKHISTIREIRNNLIHRERACLDLRTYNGYWNRVKTAICQLAKSVSSVLHKDTMKMIEELETRIMDSDELGELRNLMVDEQRFTDLKEDISGMADSLEQTRDEMTQISQGLTKKVKQVQDETQKKMSQIQRDVAKCRTPKLKEESPLARDVDNKGNLPETCSTHSLIPGVVQQPDLPGSSKNSPYVIKKQLVYIFQNVNNAVVGDRAKMVINKFSKSTDHSDEEESDEENGEENEESELLCKARENEENGAVSDRSPLCVASMKGLASSDIFL